jgi:hypothetical protein
MRDWITTAGPSCRPGSLPPSSACGSTRSAGVLQEYRQVDQLPNEMNTLTGVAEPAKLQMLVRVGRTS